MAGKGKSGGTAADQVLKDDFEGLTDRPTSGETVAHPGTEGEGDEVRLVDDEPAPGTEGSPGTAGDAGGDGTKKDPDPEKKNLQTALRGERGRRRSLLAELEVERTLRLQAEERATKAEQDKARTTDLAALDEVTNLSEAIPTITKHVKQEVEGEILAARRQTVRLSQRVARLEHEDYDSVLKDSGVEELITLDPVSHQPKDPDMWKKIYVDAEDPAEVAYQLGQEMLEVAGKRTPPAETDVDVLQGQAGDRAAGRREVIEKIDKNAARPRGLRSIPAANPPPSTVLTRNRIEKMTDAEYAKLPEHVREAYLMGRPG